MDNVIPLHPSPVDRVVALARTFPSLAKRGVETVGDLVVVSDDEHAGTGSRCAAHFVLSLVTGHPFDLRRAWGAWDDAHRAAWKAWAAKPWWA